MHAGGAVRLRHDEVPAILQRGERVLSRREVVGYGGGGNGAVNVNVMARDAESFRQSRTEVVSDIARAVSLAHVEQPRRRPRTPGDLPSAGRGGPARFRPTIGAPSRCR